MHAVCGQGLSLLLGIVRVMVLVRLLSPEDFGLVAMVAVVVGFASMLKDAGFSVATIQREALDESDVSTLFWTNCAAGLVLALLVCAASPLVASLYGEPRLKFISVVLSIGLLFGGASVQHIALLHRGMFFGRTAAIRLGGEVAMSVVMVTTGGEFGIGLVWLREGDRAATTELVAEGEGVAGEVEAG